jgi:hypothetical protein
LQGFPSTFFIVDAKLVIRSLINMVLIAKSYNHSLETITKLTLRTAFASIRLYNDECLSIKVRDTNVLASKLFIGICTWCC